MSVMCDKVLNLADRQVGYHEEGNNWTKYARYFDVEAWQWFNGKKQNVAWCAIFVCWLFCQAEIIGPKKARVFLGCPAPKDNCAAGVPYLWQYLKARKWQVDKAKGQKGDIIFFNAKCSHVGIIEKVDDSKYYTIEGNKSNQVKRCSYSKSSSSIYGLMRPAWSEIDPKEEVKPEPLPIPTPEPEPVVSNLYKVVNIKTFLAIRTQPNANGKKVGELYNDAIVSVEEQTNGWGRISGNSWVYMGYLKKI